MSDRGDTRDTRDNTRESGSMFDLRAERADTHTRGAPTDPAFRKRGGEYDVKMYRTDDFF